MIGVNVGSGQRPFGKIGYLVLRHSYVPHRAAGEMAWVNIDINPRWNPDIVAHWNRLDMFQDSSVDYVVSHHSLEHVGCGEGSAFIHEAYRILKPEGRFIVSVPDMRKLARMWLSGEITTQLYMTNVYGAYMGDEADRHAWGFDPVSLEGQLRIAPWKSVGKFDYRKILGADIARDDRWILCLEAVK